MKKYVYYIVASILIVAIAGISVWMASKPAPIVFQGEVVAKQIQISPQIIGRVVTVFVEEGESVKKGDILTKLNSPAIAAKASQAEAALKAADAQRNKVFAGARVQEVTALMNVYEKATVAEKLAQKTYERVKSLYDDGVVPAQQLDEAYTRWKAAENDVNAAKAQYEIGQIGARPEDKNAAEALTQQAAGAVQEVMSYLHDTVLTAPLDAEVMTIVVDTGELVTPGFPIMTLVDMADLWTTFNIREDYLQKIKMGTVLQIMFPAISQEKTFPMEVRYISPVGSFAVWSATKATGDFDLKTFEVKAYPVKKIDGLRSGMSAIFTLDK